MVRAVGAGLRDLTATGIVRTLLHLPITSGSLHTLLGIGGSLRHERAMVIEQPHADEAIRGA
jgi:hypothetical protein